MKLKKTVGISNSIKLIVFIFIGLIFCACNSGGETNTTLPSSTSKTEPTGYLDVSVFPGDIITNIGEEVTIHCSIMPLINTPVDISSVELALFDFNGSLIRTKPMNLENPLTATVTYIIVGDEASYKPLINFSINPSNPKFFSEYTAKAFAIKIGS